MQPTAHGPFAEESRPGGVVFLDVRPHDFDGDDAVEEFLPNRCDLESDSAPKQGNPADCLAPVNDDCSDEPVLVSNRLPAELEPSIPEPARIIHPCARYLTFECMGELSVLATNS